MNKTKTIDKFEQSHECDPSNNLLCHLVSDVATYRTAVAAREAAQRRRGCQHRVLDERV